MQQKSREQENHLAEITRLLSLYQALTLAQLEKLYPELSEEKLAALLRRLEKSGRLLLEQETGMLYRSKGVYPESGCHCRFLGASGFPS